MIWIVLNGFYGLLKKLNPNHKEPNLKTWANEIRKIVNIDNRSYNEISDLMMWVNQGQFLVNKYFKSCKTQV